MSTEAIMGRLQQFESELNQGNLESIHHYMAEDFFAYSPKGDFPKATEVFYDILSGLKTAFPDFRVAVQNLKPEGDLLKGQLTLHGTHEGSLWGAPASGVTVDWTVDLALRPVNGRFAVSLENLTPPDVIPVLRQIGMVPQPDQMDKPPKHPVSVPEILLKVLFTGQVADKPCSHLDAIQVTEPTVDVCEDCVATGDVWPALRMCLICGYVGCCDQAKNQHMKKHYEQTGHSIMRSIRLEEGWIWCYEDNAFFLKRTLGKYR